MAIICPNGHVNDDANRFCDQCGAPLQQEQDGAPAVSVFTASAPSDSGGSVICAQCGQQNLPGTAFCDNCGAELPPPQPAQDSSAMPSGVINGMIGSTDTPGSATVVCPQCGAVNNATNRFCDNCGRSLSTIDGAQQDDREQRQAMTHDADTETPSVPEQQPVDAILTEDRAATVGQAPSPTPTMDNSAERRQLEEKIATQRQVIAQLEQMQATFGTATPAAVLQGLDEARTALAQAEAELQALPVTRPQADLSEAARLEEAVATQRQVIAQLEQMQATFGTATPAAVLQGLDEARTALAQAEAELQALTGLTPAAPAVSQPSAPELATPAAPDVAAEQAGELAQQPAESAAPEAPVQAEASSGAAALQPSPQPPPREREAATAAPAKPALAAVGPRLVTHDGQTIMLPRTEGDVLIGRQDPISGIYPAVDLTPHGGEAGGVSRRHALLREQNGRWTITDLDSTNYTRINGNRIAPHTPTEIQDGTRLQLGRLELEFHSS